VLELEPFLTHKSLFLLGPRQSGKSTLLRQRYPGALYVDLLASDTFRELSRYPESLAERARASSARLIIVDEVQKLPGLLDEVQRLIDGDRGLRFVLTGSSSRKLMRGHANLLGGRALFFRLHPLVSAELDFARLPDRLRLGSLPAVLDSPIAWEELGRKGVERKTPDWGRCLEQLIFLELKAYLDYRRLDAKLSYWRSRSQLEVDFVVGSSVAIEVKGAGRVGPRDLRGLEALAEETKLARQIIVCDEPHARRIGAVDLLPIEEFLRALWSGEVIRESDG